MYYFILLFRPPVNKKIEQENVGHQMLRKMGKSLSINKIKMLLIIRLGGDRVRCSRSRDTESY